MPAARPIQIRYGDPSALGGLAAAAGTAAYTLGERRYTDQRNLLQYQGQRDDYRSQVASDQAFLGAEAQRRAEDVWRGNELDFRYSAMRSPPQSAMMLQDAAGYGGVQTFRRSADPMRQIAQASGTTTSAAGQGASPLQLVPAEGPLGGTEPSMTMRTSDGREYGQYRGGTPYSIAAGASEEDRRLARGDAQQLDAELPRMVAPETRERLDAVMALQGVIPTDQWNALWTAVQSGQIDMNQTLTQSRGMMPSSGRMNAWERDVEGFQSETNELSRVKDFPRDRQIAYARRKLRLDPKTSFGEGYTDDEALARLQAYTQEMDAFSRPITNTNGSTPTGGNWIQISSPEEAAALPEGTRYMTPDGQAMVR